MNVMMMALLRDRLWQMVASLERRLDFMRSYEGTVANACKPGLQLESMQPEAAEAELAQVLRALELFDEGLYGVCDAAVIASNLTTCWSDLIISCVSGAAHRAEAEKHRRGGRHRHRPASSPAGVQRARPRPCLGRA